MNDLFGVTNASNVITQESYPIANRLFFSPARHLIIWEFLFLTSILVQERTSLSGTRWEGKQLPKYKAVFVHTLGNTYGFFVLTREQCTNYRDHSRECTRSGFCNFMHLRPISRELRKELYGRKRGGGGVGGGREYIHQTNLQSLYFPVHFICMLMISGWRCIDGSCRLLKWH